MKLAVLILASVATSAASAEASLPFPVPGSTFLVPVPCSVPGSMFAVQRPAFEPRTQNDERRTDNRQPRTEPRTRTRNQEPGTRNRPQLPRVRRPPPAPVRFGIRGYLVFGASTLEAQETFEAVAGTHTRSIVGGGAQVTRIWKDVFADVAGSQLSLDGERVFVDNRRVFKLGIPLEVTMRPVDLAAGWRFRIMRGRVLPYGGAGMSYVQYKETSDFADGSENVSESSVGPLVLGGVEVRVWRWIAAGGEFRWRRLRGILGERGASAEFGEDDVGGVNAGVRISIGLN